MAASAHGGRSGDFSFGTFSIASASEHFAHVAGEWNRFGVVRSNPAQVGSLSFADLPSVPLPLGEIAGIAGAIVPIVGSGQRGQPPASHGLATDVRLVSLRPGGNVVVVTADGIIERLIGDSAVARGGFVLTITAYLDQGEAITEANRAWRFTVQRTGGSTGPVSVEYRVVGEEVHGALGDVHGEGELRRPECNDQTGRPIGSTCSIAARRSPAVRRVHIPKFAGSLSAHTAA